MRSSARSAVHGVTHVAVTCALVALAAAPAFAGPDASSSELTLTRTPSGGTVRAVTLLCEADGGDHPAPEAACNALQDARGDFDALDGAGDAYTCGFGAAPVSITAEGVWEGEPVSMSKEFLNPCFLDAAMGVVFDF